MKEYSNREKAKDILAGAIALTFFIVLICRSPKEFFGDLGMAVFVTGVIAIFVWVAFRLACMAIRFIMRLSNPSEAHNTAAHPEER